MKSKRFCTDAQFQRAKQLAAEWRRRVLEAELKSKRFDDRLLHEASPGPRDRG